MLQHRQFRPWRASTWSARSPPISCCTGAGLDYWWALILSPLDRRRARRGRRARVPQSPRRPRPALRPAAHLRPRAGHPGLVPELFRRLRHALRDPAQLSGGLQSRLHVPAELSRLGDRRSRRRVPGDLVHDREDEARRLSARGDRKPDAGARLRHQRAADGHADLRLRRRAGRAWPACSPRRSTRFAPAWAPTSSPSCSRWW